MINMFILSKIEIINLIDIETLEARHSGKYISNVMFDAGQVQHLVSTGVLNIMKDSLTLIALVSVMFYQNWKLSIFALIMMPLAASLAKTLGKKIGKGTSQASEISGRLTSFLSEILKGSKMIRIYQKENRESVNANNLILFFLENMSVRIVTPISPP